MPFSHHALGRFPPASIRQDVELPRRVAAFPSPVDWRDEALYFLLVDRFSDGGEASRPLLDRGDLAAARALPDGQPWRWDHWARSGGERWQGGTIAGVSSKLGYLQGLGVTTIWLSPVFRQRAHLDTYHGYGVQDFLDVDARLGTRDDLVALVEAAHARGMRVILDIIFNHTGSNWVYAEGTPGGIRQPSYTRGRHAFGAWLDAHGAPADGIAARADGVWPRELQEPDRYTRAGSGGLGAGDLDDPDAEHKRTDFLSLRDLRLDAAGYLGDLARCYKYWIALTDCDGFRIDTLKHVSLEQARNFCGTVKEFASNIGKKRFFLVAEVAGGDYAQDRYLDVLERNLDAALDIGELRLALRGVARGLQPAGDFFAGFDPGRAVMGSHRNLGERHVSVLDDHDHVFGEKLRVAATAPTRHQGAAGVALQAFTLGIPCVYYGTEQGFAGPEIAERQWLPGWGGDDRYLREAMFGPAHPRRAGADGLRRGTASLDRALPGFGPFGTAGHHCFDAADPVYRRVAAILALRGELPALRQGRQYARPVSLFGGPFVVPNAGEIVAWSRILDDEEVVCVLNAHGTEARGGDVLVDATLNAEGSSLAVVLSSAEAAGAAGVHRRGDALPVRRRDDVAYVEIRDVAPSEVLVLASRPDASEGAVRGRRRPRRAPGG